MHINIRIRMVLTENFKEHFFTDIFPKNVHQELSQFHFFNFMLLRKQKWNFSYC